MIIISEEKLEAIIENAYVKAYKKCMTDVVEHCDFVYEVIAEKAKQDIYAEFGIIPEVSKELEQEVFEC